jgi:hypothetical protein
MCILFKKRYKNLNLNCQWGVYPMAPNVKMGGECGSFSAKKFPITARSAASIRQAAGEFFGARAKTTFEYRPNR